MANITISNLHPVDSDLLFANSESYMVELSESEVSIQGGSIILDAIRGLWEITRKLFY